MVKTEIRTPDPAEQPHEFQALNVAHLCEVCGRGRGHHIHDVPPAEIHTGTVECCAGCERALYAAPDMVNHPPHYTAHPSGVEVIQITEHLGFCLGNVVKYVLRADHKGDAVADLEKAAWYLAREIARRKSE